MKAFFSFMIRWVIPVLGLIALSLIIWFVGPLLDVLVPEGRRWALIVLVFALWVTYRVFRIIQARRQAAEVMRSLAAETPVDPNSVATAEELSTLRQRMDEALALLKKAKLGGDERRNLYELPWYVIIGPPGSGKTTALVNSGLHFPLAAQLGAGAVRGVGVRATATGGLPTRPYCSTPLAAIPPRTATPRWTKPPGWAFSIC